MDEPIFNLLWRQKVVSSMATLNTVFCAQGGSCTCTPCAWTAWKGFTRSSASSVSRGGTAAGTSWAPCTPMTSWPPLRAVRLVLAPQNEQGGRSGFCPRANVEELEWALQSGWGRWRVWGRGFSSEHSRDPSTVHQWWLIDYSVVQLFLVYYAAVKRDIVGIFLVKNMMTNGI